MKPSEVNSLLKQAELELSHTTCPVKRRVLENIKLVPWVVFRYFSTTPFTHDLFQQGTMGLMHAARHFKKEKNVKFGSYATWCIKGFILRSFRKSKSAVFNKSMLQIENSNDVLDNHTKELFGRDEIKLVLDQVDDRQKEILIRRYGLMGRPKETLDTLSKEFHLCRERIRQIENQAKEIILDKLKRKKKLNQIGDFYD